MHDRGKNSKMNRQEFLLNKPLLKEIHGKRKDESVQGDGYTTHNHENFPQGA